MRWTRGESQYEDHLPVDGAGFFRDSKKNNYGHALSRRQFVYASRRAA